MNIHPEQPSDYQAIAEINTLTFERDIESPFPVSEEVFMVKPPTNYRQHYQGKVVFAPNFREV